MGQEIERKFLVDIEILQQDPEFQNSIPHSIIQGYILNSPDQTIRVRIKDAKGFLTIKGKQSGLSRSEFEYQIPHTDAQEILSMVNTKVLAKKRYEIKVGEHLWEVDIFEGDNKGLIIAEIELQSEDEAFCKPLWVLNDVSTDLKYTNALLINHPFSHWT